MLIDPANVFGNFEIPHVHFCKIGKSMLLNLSLLSARCHQITSSHWLYVIKVESFQINRWIKRDRCAVHQKLVILTHCCTQLFLKCTFYAPWWKKCFYALKSALTDAPYRNPCNLLDMSGLVFSSLVPFSSSGIYQLLLVCFLNSW